MSLNRSKKYSKFLSGKIILALVIACAAILLSLFITKLTFRKVLFTVNKLSEPKPRLQLVNKVFRKAVKLDQLQREQALKAPGNSYNPFFRETREIKLILDTLHSMSANDPSQIVLIDSMKKILTARDRIFLSYLDLRKDFINNDTLTAQIRSLSASITDSARHTDSSVITTRQQITTTTVEDLDTIGNDTRQTFWDKLLGRRKTPEYIQKKRLIQEELNIKVDTLVMAKEDSLFQQLTTAIAAAEANRNKTRSLLVTRQVQLNRMGNLLLSQLLGILHQLEMEELKDSQRNNARITGLVGSSISQMNTIIIAFIFSIAILSFLIFADIANSNRYRKELLLAKEEAEQLGRVKQRFLANMSHELRTPLQSIVGIAEQAYMKRQAGTQDINIIYRSSRHLLQIVNQVLDYSHVISDKFRLENKRFNIRQLLDEVKEAMEVMAAEKGLQFIYEPNVDDQTCYMGDPFRLRQILYNLLGNAVRFTRNGSITLAAAYRDYSERTVFTFSVKDTGIGIPEADAERIFNRFEQGDDPDAANQRGTGLGLSIVKTLVESQQGTIDLSSAPGKGSVFTVTIPYKRTKQKAADAYEPTPAERFKGSVWVVDDDAFILQICDHILSKYELPHRCFQSVTEVLNTEPPEDLAVVFLDIRMPLMNGQELLYKLKPILDISVKYYALTAQALPGDRETIIQNGFDGLLMKPFVEREFLGMLQAEPQDVPADIGQEVDHLRLMTGGDPLVVKKILGNFITETQSDLAGYRDSIANDEHLVAADYLHKLSGRFGQIGFVQQALDLRSAELLIRNEGQWSGIKDLLGELGDEIHIKTRVLADYLKSPDHEIVPT